LGWNKDADGRWTPLFQKLPKNAENLLNLTARNAVWDTVNVARPT